MSQAQEQQQQVNISVNDLIFAQVKDLGKRMDRVEKALDITRNELNARMDRLEHRQDKLEEKLEITHRELNARMDKQDAKIEKLADKIDRLSDKIDSSSNRRPATNFSPTNIWIVTVSVAVIYSIIK